MKIAIIGGIIFIVLLGVAAFYFFGQTFMYTEGVSETQLNNYENAIDGANSVQETVNKSNKNAMEKLNQIQNTPAQSY